MTAGNCGSAELEPTEIGEVRREEAQAVGVAFTLRLLLPRVPRSSDCVRQSIRRRVAEFLRIARPDLIFAPPPIDYMADHEITSRLVRDAAFNASVPNYHTDAEKPHPPAEKIPHLYYMDPIEGTDYYGRELPAGFLVDITSVFDTKRAMLACHASQRNWLFKQHGIDEYLDAQERWSRKRGREAGVEYAESFNQHKGHPFPQSNLLAELVAGWRRLNRWVWKTGLD